MHCSKSCHQVFFYSYSRSRSSRACSGKLRTQGWNTPWTRFQSFSWHGEHIQFHTRSLYSRQPTSWHRGTSSVYSCLVPHISTISTGSFMTHEWELGENQRISRTSFQKVFTESNLTSGTLKLLGSNATTCCTLWMKCGWRRSLYSSHSHFKTQRNPFFLHVPAYEVGVRGQDQLWYSRPEAEGG